MKKERQAKTPPKPPYATLGERLRKEWRIYVGAIGLVVAADAIGKFEIPIGPGKLILFPIFYALILGVVLGPQVLKIFKETEVKAASGLVLTAIGPFIAKLGITAGQNIGQVLSAGPALFLREIGNLSPIFIALPVALLLGMKRESIGACHSLNREVNLALISDVYGADSAESRGSLSIYIVGGMIGTLYFGFMATVCAATGLWSPEALAMASGVGAAIMMAAASASLASIYPGQAEQLMALAGASAALTSIVGIYMGLFVALPMANWLYRKLEPVLGNLGKKKQEPLLAAKGMEEPK